MGIQLVLLYSVLTVLAKLSSLTKTPRITRDGIIAGGAEIVLRNLLGYSFSELIDGGITLEIIEEMLRQYLMAKGLNITKTMRQGDEITIYADFPVAVAFENEEAINAGYDNIYSYLNLNAISSDFEIFFEADPEQNTPEKLQAMSFFKNAFVD